MGAPAVQRIKNVAIFEPLNTIHLQKPPTMVAKTRKKPTVWQSILKVVLGILVTVLTSQLASTNPIVDNALKTTVIQAGNVVIDALTASGSDSIKKDTVYVTTDASVDENN